MRRSLTALALTLGIAGTVAGQYPSNESLLQIHEKARRLGNTAEGHYYRGLNNWRDASDPWMATQDFTEAIRRDPKLVLAHEARGAARLELHLYDEAIADFTEAIRLRPRAETFLHRGLARYLDGAD